MTNRKDQNLRQPPPGVTFVRNRAEKEKVFLAEMREIEAEFEKEGRMTPIWRQFFDRIFSAEGIPDTVWEDFFAAAASDETGNKMTEDEVEALIACIDYDAGEKK